MPRNNSRFIKKRINKGGTNKTIDKITYSPKKHKQKCKRNLRQKLQKKRAEMPCPSATPPDKMKFGSFNVDGVDLEVSFAVEKLLERDDFDVSNNLHPSHDIIVLGVGSK